MDRKTAEQLNEYYFITLANSRGSISLLKISLAGLIISLINIWPSYAIVKSIEKGNPWINILNASLMCISLLMLFLFVISFWNKILYKWQVFSEILVLIMLILLCFTLVYLSYFIAIYTGGGEDSLPLNSYVFSLKSYIFIVITFFLFIVSVTYNMNWLKQQLKVGFPEERTQKNLLAKPAVYNSKSLWIIFGGMSVSRFISGQLLFVLGLGGGILFVLAFSRLIVEIAYLTYLKSKNKVYWEEPPVPEKLSIEEQKKRRSKIIKIVNIIASIALVYLIGFLLVEMKGDSIIATILRVVIDILLLNLLAMLILWIIKKIKNYLQKDK